MGNVYSLASETLESKLGKAQSQGCPGCSAEPDLHSKGQSRAGEEKLLLANTAKKTLPVTAQNPATVVVPAKGMPAPGHPRHALQEQREAWLGPVAACGRKGWVWDRAEELQVSSSSSILVLGKERQCWGLPTGKQAAKSSGKESQDPEQQLPALWHWRGAIVPVPRAVGLALPEHISCPDLGFLLLKIPWLSCSLRPGTILQLSWCLPGAAWDM